MRAEHHNSAVRKNLIVQTANLATKARDLCGVTLPLHALHGLGPSLEHIYEPRVDLRDQIAELNRPPMRILSREGVSAVLHKKLLDIGVVRLDSLEGIAPRAADDAETVRAVRRSPAAAVVCRQRRVRRLL